MCQTTMAKATETTGVSASKHGTLSLLFLLLAGSLTHCRSHSPSPPPLTRSFKGMFVFGSSLVDNGNNKFLTSLSEANYTPYGVDFPYGPTGRFTNGKNVVDFFTDYLGLPFFSPPFLDPSAKGSKIAYGVNFASGGSGIMEDTGFIFGEVVSLKKQIDYFENKTKAELETVLGESDKEWLSKYLFFVGTGGNDYSFNYFISNPPNTEFDTDDKLQAFTSNLTAELSLHLQRLYVLGARKFVLTAVYPIGCYPYVKAGRPNRRGCIQSMNRAAHLFNSNLLSLADSLPRHMPNTHFVILNAYKITRDIIKNPLREGFVYAEESCCHVQTLDEGGNGALCKSGGSVCSNRTNYVFFDGLHPSEAVNAQIATKAFTSQRKVEVYPFNIQHLASLV